MLDIAIMGSLLEFTIILIGIYLLAGLVLLNLLKEETSSTEED